MENHLMSRKRAFAYRRRSPRPDEDYGNTSLEKQEDEIIKYCERNSIELVQIYTDDLKSGKSFKGRDEFKEMYHRALSKEEEIDYIIVLKQDRLSRDTLDTLYIMKRLNEAGVHLISIADNINTEDPKAEILVPVMSLVAQLEREFISFRTASGMEKKAESGAFLGGRVFGYESYNKELSIVPEEARIVKYIFEKYALDLWGYRKIASNLNMQGLRQNMTKNGLSTPLRLYYRINYIWEISSGGVNTQKDSMYLLLKSRCGIRLMKLCKQEVICQKKFTMVLIHFRG